MTTDVQDFSRVSIFGHSMGGALGCSMMWAELTAGHGALSLYLKNPDKYKSASAFAPAW